MGLPCRLEWAYAWVMAQLQDAAAMDWTDCALVEVVPGKVSGVPLLKGTRLPADTVLSNFESGSPVEEISDNFDIPDKTIRDLLSYAANKQKQPRPRESCLTTTLECFPGAGLERVQRMIAYYQVKLL